MIKTYFLREDLIDMSVKSYSLVDSVVCHEIIPTREAECMVEQRNRLSSPFSNIS
jgi:hypothetical protein